MFNETTLEVFYNPFYTVGWENSELSIECLRPSLILHRSKAMAVIYGEILISCTVRLHI